MIQTQLTVETKQTIAPAWWRLTVTGPALPGLAPGQFLMVRCADALACYLRRPVFPRQTGPHQFEWLLRPHPDPGLAWLVTRKPGDTLDVLGPLGNGFPLPDTTRNLLLVSDTQTVTPLLGLVEQAVTAGKSVTLVLGGRTASSIYPVTELPAAVEVHAATLDGSLGRRGPLTDLLPDLICWADTVCAVGSAALYQMLQQQANRHRIRLELGFLYALYLNHPLPCGLGTCDACLIDTPAGAKRLCTSGPVLDLGA